MDIDRTLGVVDGWIARRVFILTETPVRGGQVPCKYANLRYGKLVEARHRAMVLIAES